MDKKRATLEDEMDVTQASVRDLTSWCIKVALHQEFGVGRERLEKLEKREYEMAVESMEVVMTPDEDGRPQIDRAQELREAAIPEGAPKEFRVPLLRAARTRREQQLRMAGDRAACLTWQLYAAACAELLGFGPARLKRLHEEARKNYEQVNAEANTDGIDVAMEHLRRCACAALQTDQIVVDQEPEERWLQGQRQVQREKEEEFLRRAIRQKAGRMLAAHTAPTTAADMEIRKKFEDALAAVQGDWRGAVSGRTK